MLYRLGPSVQVENNYGTESVKIRLNTPVRGYKTPFLTVPMCATIGEKPVHLDTNFFPYACQGVTKTSALGRHCPALGQAQKLQGKKCQF